MGDTKRLQSNNRLSIMAMETIFDNIKEYQNNTEELVKALEDVGIEDYEQFQMAKNDLQANVPRSIQNDLQNYYAGHEDRVWEKYVAKGSKQAYEEYLKKHPTGKYCDEAKRHIEQFNNKEKIEKWEADWQRVDKDDLDALQKFVDECADNEHRKDAMEIIDDLRSGKNSVDVLMEKLSDLKNDKSILDPEEEIYKKILDFIITPTGLRLFNKALAKDNNIISDGVAKKLKEKAYFSFNGIDYDFVRQLDKNTESTRLPESGELKNITMESCTEVYFWGIPSSGKTCALGALLSCANSAVVCDNMDMNNHCQGYGYMRRLSDLFRRNSIGVLPGGTATSATFEMGFTLVVKEGKKRIEYPLTFVDLAGELIRCMYKKDAGENMSDDERSALQTMTNVMSSRRGGNRKMHFFVVEYGAENRRYEGLPQDVYLDAAVKYIRDTNIFKKDTDAISILITKADKANVSEEGLQEVLSSYILDNYKGFYNGLRDICQQNEINGGRVEVLPFSLGKVCFQKYCKFDDEAAQNVIKFILSHAYGKRTGRFFSVLDIFRK